MIFCTLADINYAPKAMAMIDSLRQNYIHRFKIYFLAMDDATMDFLAKKQRPEIIPISVNQLIEKDIALRKIKQNPIKTKYGDAHASFCWSCTPYFIWWLLYHKIQHNAELMYVDADIYFYKTPGIIVDDCIFADIGVHTHRNIPEGETYNSELGNGKYNVGVVFFRNNFNTQKIVTWWKDVCLSDNHVYYEQYGTCGDQKYLDLLDTLFPDCKIHVFDKSFIGHGAPWNFMHYEFKDGNVFWRKIKQTIIFNHFSHFQPGTPYKTSLNGEWAPEKTSETILGFYEQYNKAVIEHIGL